MKTLAAVVPHDQIEFTRYALTAKGVAFKLGALRPNSDGYFICDFKDDSEELFFFRLIVITGGSVEE